MKGKKKGWDEKKPREDIIVFGYEWVYNFVIFIYIHIHVYMYVYVCTISAVREGCFVNRG